MPLGKYYCDYCDKQFQDTPFHRKRHIQGSQHQRAKALWYASFRHPPNNQILNHHQDPIPPQGVCNRFVTTGSCRYGDSCKYYHPKQNPQNMSMQGIAVMSFTNTPSPHFIGSQPVGGASLPDDMVRDGMGVTWGNLPPSLRPPPEGGYSSLPFVDWG